MILVNCLLIFGNLAITGGKHRRFKGMRDCIFRTVRDEGVRSLWRGNGSSVLRHYPSVALNFSLKVCLKFYGFLCWLLVLPVVRLVPLFWVFQYFEFTMANMQFFLFLQIGFAFFFLGRHNLCDIASYIIKVTYVYVGFLFSIYVYI